MSAASRPLPPRLVHLWTLNIRHLHGRQGLVVDTHVSLHRSDEPASRLLICKTLDEIPGHLPPPALMVSEERAAITRLQSKGLPCVALVGEDVTGPQGPYALWTEYAGPSVQEVFRHALPQADYGHLLHAVMRTYAAFAAAGELPLDAVQRNVLVQLSHQNEGHLMFDAVRSVDHAHTIGAGHAAGSRSPFIKMEDGSAPEIADLLRKDRERPLPQQAPGCPFASLADLRLRSAAEQAFWLERMDSPFLGGALDRGELDLGRAIQSVFATGLLSALRRQRMAGGADLLPSERWTTEALGYLDSMLPVLQRMASSRPQDRFPSLQDAGLALAAGLPLPRQSTGRIQLIPPQGETVLGGSQPETEAPDDFDPLDDLLATTDEAAGMAGPQGSSRTQLGRWWATPRPAGNRRANPWLGALAAIVGVALLLWASWVPDPTPTLVAQARQFHELSNLQRRWRQQKDWQALRVLVQLARTGGETSAVQPVARRFVDSAWAGLQLKLSVAARNPHAANRHRLVAEIERWASIEFEPAVVWRKQCRVDCGRGGNVGVDFLGQGLDGANLHWEPEG